MLKELILAIIVGALLGVGLTGGYLALNKKKVSPDNNPPVITSPTLIPDSNDSQDSSKEDLLVIDSIEDYDIVSKEKLEISGTFTPDSIIIITLGDDIFSDSTDDQGKFQFDLSLDSGLNIIKITAIDSQDNQLEKTLNITYSTAEI